MADPVYLTINEFPGTGAAAPTVVDFNFAGGYISPAHVKAEIFNPVTYLRTPVTVTDDNFVTDYRLSLPVVVPTGSILRVYRDTPKDQPLVDFTNGARIAENNLDLVAQQAVFVAAESADQIAATQVADVLQAVEAAALSAAAAQVDAAASAASATLSQTAAQDGASIAGGFALAAAASAATSSTSAAASAAEATAVRADLASTASGKGAEMVAFKQSGTGAVDRMALAKMQESVSVDDFGALGDGSTDDTTAIQAALNAANDVYFPPGVYNFTTLTVRQNTRLRGASSRTSVLKHTGSGVAVTCTHSGATEPDGNGAYIESGWFTFQDFTLLANGTIGFNVGKTRSSFTNWERVYIRHRQDSGGFFAGSTAINCDNSPWLSSYATYLSKLDNVFIRGFENGVNLNATVNAWQLNRVYMIEVKNQIVLSAATGISVDACYFESGIAAARGIVFGAGGGNTVGVTDSSFELTNVAGTQYAFDFSAGGTWAQINVRGCKYLLQGDGNGVNNRRIIGTAPAGFLELGRSYTNTTLSKDLPMLWAPGAAANHPVQIPNFSRLGGTPGGNGRLILGRGGSDANDGYIQNDGVYGLDFVAPSTGSVVDFDWMGNDGTLHLRYQGYAGGTGSGFYATTDNATTLGNSGRRWSQTYSREFRPGTGAPIWTSGAGTPEGTVTAPVGSLYTRTDGGAATTLYVKETGAGNTGWVAK